MNLFGIGPMEVVFIILLVLIIFGPKEIQRTGKTIGKNLYKLTHSESWRAINQTRRELSNLPSRLIRESGLDEIQEMSNQELSEAKTEVNQIVSSLNEPLIVPQAKSPKPEAPGPEKNVQYPDTDSHK
jgi:Sec-independent protein translocase protein TatA